MKPSLSTLLAVSFAGFALVAAHAGDVLGYSVIKGHFLNQTDPDTLVTDPDFGFSILASVNLTDFYLVSAASVRPPGGSVVAMDDLGDSWDFLDSVESLAALNVKYGWGNYTISFTAENDGKFTCALNLPETPLPPTPKLLNFTEVQSVNAAKALTLHWDFSETPEAGDFVQVYLNEGHAEVFSTPNYGEPEALDGTSRLVTIPASTLEPGIFYSLNIEITRLAGTNSLCYPDAEGVTATFASTSVDLVTLTPPTLRLISPPQNGTVSIEVRAEPGKTVVLQGSPVLAPWTNLQTNATPSGTNLFNVPVDGSGSLFFRAWQP